MTEPENLPREQGSDANNAVCLTCGEPLTATGEAAENGSSTFEPHVHEQSEQAGAELPREHGTDVPQPGQQQQGGGGVGAEAIPGGGA